MNLEMSTAKLRTAARRRRTPKIAHYVDGHWLTYDDIASEVGAPADVVRARVFRLKAGGKTLTLEAIGGRAA